MISKTFVILGVLFGAFWLSAAVAAGVHFGLVYAARWFGALKTTSGTETEVNISGPVPVEVYHHHAPSAKGTDRG